MNTIDEILKAAYLATEKHEGIQQPSAELLNILHELGVLSSYRLAYRSEPIYDDGPPSFHTPMNVGFSFLTDDIQSTVDTDIFTDEQRADWAWLSQLISPVIPFLTYIDAAACMSESFWSPLVKQTVETLTEIYEVVHSQRRSIIQDEEDAFFPEGKIAIRLENCRTFMMAQRLVFYVGRLKGKSVSEIQTDFMKMQEDLGLMRWDLGNELSSIKTLIEEQKERLANEDAAQNVILELDPDVCVPVSLSNYTSNVEESFQCSICFENIEIAGVKTPCDHKFCADCIHTWVHAGNESSHMCPYCRSELFPERRSRVSAMEAIVQIQHVRRSMEEFQDAEFAIRQSGNFLNAEISLQMDFEQATK